MNIGLELEGYNIYYAPAGTSNWTTKPIITQEMFAREAPNLLPPIYDNYRAEWTCAFGIEDLTANNVISEEDICENDQLKVVPVFSSGEGGADTWSDPVLLPFPPNARPTAA